MSHGPLGKYSQMVAAVLATFIVVAAVAMRIIGVFVTGTVFSVPFIDNAAWVALGAVFGASAATSVNGNQIQAAHRRLDQISAPPADYLAAKSGAETDS